MKKNSLYFAFFFVMFSSLSAQTNVFKISPYVVMPEDSLERKALLSSMNGFLSSAQENSQNQWILPSQSIETQILIDEIQHVQKSKEFEDDSFFSAYLTKITPLQNKSYAVHVAYIGINEQSAILRANFELIAHKTKDVYLISSPLIRNTQNWKTTKIQNHIFRYPDTLDAESVQQYCHLTSLFNEKLKYSDGESHYYLCNNEMDPLKLFGVEYKADYNGQELNSSWESSTDKKNLFVITASKFYSISHHDLWHHSLSQIISRKAVHRRVDCHIATLYGGLWSKSWEELFPIFREKYVVGKNVDWLEHKNNSSHFVIEGRKNYSDDFVGALIIKEIEKGKGFDGVWELLMTKRTKEEEEYFAALDRLIGINKENYNKEVFLLIEEEMNNLGIN